MLTATHADLTAIAKADTLLYKCEGPVVLTIGPLFCILSFLLLLVNNRQITFFNRAVKQDQ